MGPGRPGMGRGTNRPDVLTRRPQQLHNQVNLVDLRRAREEGLVGQQLSQDAAHGPAGEGSQISLSTVLTLWSEGAVEGTDT